MLLSSLVRDDVLFANRVGMLEMEANNLFETNVHGSRMMVSLGLKRARLFRVHHSFTRARGSPVCESVIKKSLTGR